VACVRVPDGAGGRRQEVRTYQAFSSGLASLAEWLQGHGVTQVVLEATGQCGRVPRTGGAAGRLQGIPAADRP
jgi:hypothetical protein